AYVLGEMERHGIAVDGDDLQVLGVELRQQLERLEHEAFTLAGRSFNLASPKQVGEVLFDEMKLPVKKRTRSGYSTDAEVLERLRSHHPIAEVLLDHRRLSKLITTYTDVLHRAVNPETGRIHATFQQTGAATGRLGTTEPDLQKTPVRSKEGQRIRRAFHAPAGQQLVVADWNQIELRLLAHFTQDAALVAAFTHGVDVHQQTAAELFGLPPEAVSREQRTIGKTVNFATLYGQGATALSQQLGVSRIEAKQYIDRYFQLYAGVASWTEGVVAEAYGLGYVTTLLGRRRYLPLLSSRSVVERQAGERMAANTIIQGSAADLCKLAMLQLADELYERALPARLLLQVHDELVLEAPQEVAPDVASLLRDVMEGVGALQVPLVVDVGMGPSWAEAKSGEARPS
ncbi:MAG: DNA polymerase, partial [Myxococcota bacterium]